jgi:phospholipid/cholesterol/gamma-HCH transport system substrate-binding protein
MNKEIRIAILFILSAIILLLGYKFIIGKSVLSSKQIFYVRYKNIDQLQVSNPVMINGFEVGAVNKIFLDPKDNITPIVELEIKNNIKVPRTAKAFLSSIGVMGGKAIQLEYEGLCTDCAKSGDTLTAGVKSLLGNFVGDGEIEEYTQKIKNSALSIFDTLAGAGGKKEIKEGVQNFERTLQNLATTTSLLNHLLQKNSSKLDRLISNLESVVSNIQSSNKEIGQILRNFDTVSTQVKNADLSKTINGFNATLGEGKKAIIELQSAMGSAEKTMNSVSQLIKKAESGDGTAAKILNDPALYQNLTKTSKQLEALLQDLRLNPKRYINVSVFGKKQKTYVPWEQDPLLQTDSLPIKKEPQQPE